jgi:class 3 adenylate cyclase/tetratricopeptide (TPR) repeat protein
MQCATCNAENPASNLFCGACGAALAPSAAKAVASPAPVAERRLCAVLFCDLVGFTPLSESRDPEEVRELLSRYFEASRAVIDRYGGVVEKFIGDAVMAVWGTPLATEGDAERAVRAGLDLVVQISALGTETGIDELAARVGVVTGEVAVTIGATNEGMVAGDAVNTAARVQAAAAGGTVLVDSATRRLASNAVSFEDAGEHLLKGKAAPQQLWRAVRPLSGTGRSQRIDGLEAPQVGRDPDVQLIRELFHAAIDGRTPSLVMVSGPAGVGKSRLGWELQRYVDGLAIPVAWHRGRCLSYGDGVAFWALAEIVRVRFGITEEDPLDIATEKLTVGLEEVIADPADRSYVGARLGRLLGVPYGLDNNATLGRDDLFAGWRTFFQHLAESHAVVIAIEDAHHADAGLLDFLDYLIDWARDLPIVILVFARGELDQIRPEFGSGPNRTTLTLDPLDLTTTGLLIEALVPGMPAPARDAITGRAQGIPLFAVEIIRSLVDRGIVGAFEGRYRVVGDIGDITLPDTLHALLAARLDALDPDVRRLVADAAVLGTNFPAEALVSITGRDPDQVRSQLAYLLRREVLTVSADPLSPERGTYWFSQDLLRQVAYETLSRRDRKAKHLRVAEHLRNTFANDGEEAIEVIARHYFDAMSAVASDADRDELRRLAIATSVRAGERGERVGASSSAARSYVTAAKLEEQYADDIHNLAAAALWERSALAAANDADRPFAIDCYLKSEVLWSRCGRPRDAARAMTGRARSVRNRGHYTEAIELLRPAVQALWIDPDADTVNALTTLAETEAQLCTDTAEQLSISALDLGQRLDVDGGLMARALIARGVTHQYANRHMEAAAYYRHAAEVARSAGNHVVYAVAMGSLSDVLLADNPAEAATSATEAAAHARRYGLRDVHGVATVNCVIAWLQLGDWDRAAQIAADARADGAADPHEIGTAQTWVAALRGDVPVAQSILESLGRYDDSDNPQDHADLAVLQSLLAAADGDDEAALSAGRRTVQSMDFLGIRTEFVRWGWPVAARAAAALDDNDTLTWLLALLDAQPEGAVPAILRAERDLVRAKLLTREDLGSGTAAVGAAIVQLRAVGSPYHVAHALIDHAELLATIGVAEAATTSLDEARAIANQLSCRPLHDRLDQAASRTSVLSPQQLNGLPSCSLA